MGGVLSKLCPCRTALMYKFCIIDLTDQKNPQIIVEGPSEKNIFAAQKAGENFKSAYCRSDQSWAVFIVSVCE